MLLVLALAVAIVISAVTQQSNRSTLQPGSGESGIDGGAQENAADGSGAGGSSTDAAADTAANGSGPIIFVHVLGSIANPGLYELSDGARVVDVIAAAGGLAENADPAGVNLARVLSDGEQLYVPAVGEVDAGGGAAGGAGGVCAG